MLDNLPGCIKSGMPFDDVAHIIGQFGSFTGFRFLGVNTVNSKTRNSPSQKEDRRIGYSDRRCWSSFRREGKLNILFLFSSQP